MIRFFLKKKLCTRFWFLFFSKKEIISSMHSKFIFCYSEISFFHKIGKLFMFFKKILAISCFKITTSLIFFFHDSLYIKTVSSSLYKKNNMSLKSILNIKNNTAGYVIFNIAPNFPFKYFYKFKQEKWICIGYINRKFSMFPFDYKILIDYSNFFCIYFFNLFFIRYFLKR